MTAEGLEALSFSASQFSADDFEVETGTVTVIGDGTIIGDDTIIE